jgi:hypothetical protein
LPGGRKKAQRAVIARERMVHAVMLRRAGASFRDIAAQIHVSPRAAWKLVQKAFELQRKHLAADIEVIRDLELERLDAMLLSAWKLMHGKDAEPQTVLGAIDRVLRIQERRAKMIFGIEKGEQPPPPDEAARVETAMLPYLRAASTSELLEFKALLLRIRDRKQAERAGPQALATATNIPRQEVANGEGRRSATADGHLGGAP